MAGSRLEKCGTVFTRVRDLMRSGVIKPAEKPIWFDVYAAFPPKREPLYVRPVRNVRRRTEESAPDIFYKEDEIRAKFFELYGSGPKPLDLTHTNFVSTCQRFVETYSQLESRGDVEPEQLLEATGKALLADGIVLRRKGGPAMAAKSRDPVLGMKLAEMLAEQQIDTAAPVSASDDHPQSVSTDGATTL